MRQEALFPGLMGERFASLHPHLRTVHGGSGGRWTGTATVQRGSHWLLRAAAFLARLPSPQNAAATVVTIEAGDGFETWTRQFGTAAPMRSRLRHAGGLLEEQLGLVTLQFRILSREGGVCWELKHIALLGMPLPARWFPVQAGAYAGSHGYRFLVAASVRGVGELVRYEGELDVPG
jgi:hypothetical protein